MDVFRRFFMLIIAFNRTIQPYAQLMWGTISDFYGVQYPTDFANRTP